jgi:hypothetical protein
MLARYQDHRERGTAAAIAPADGIGRCRRTTTDEPRGRVNASPAIPAIVVSVQRRVVCVAPRGVSGLPVEIGGR